MRIAHPRTLPETIRALAEHPDAQIVAGGTDFMVEVNAGLRWPLAIVTLRRVADLKGARTAGDEVVLGAGLTYSEIGDDAMLAREVPMLVQAARSVGSRQIRNAGTVGGNIGTASPAGDTLPVLMALDATVVLVSAAGSRSLPLHDVLIGPKQTCLAPDEIIQEIRVRRLCGPQQFVKVGLRGAMTIAITSCALAVDRDRRQVRCALGAVGPAPIRPTEAESFIAGEIDWDHGSAPAAALARFEVLVRRASRPIDDHRASAAYRRHAVGVIARRALERGLRDVR